MKCRVWSVECEEWSAKCEVWSSKCDMWNREALRGNLVVSSTKYEVVRRSVLRLPSCCFSRPQDIRSECSTTHIKNYSTRPNIEPGFHCANIQPAATVVCYILKMRQQATNLRKGSLITEISFRDRLWVKDVEGSVHRHALQWSAQSRHRMPGTAGQRPCVHQVLGQTFLLCIGLTRISVDFTWAASW